MAARPDTLAAQADSTAMARRTPLAGFSAEERARILAHTERVEVAAGTVLVREGEQSQDMYFVLAGEARLRRARHRVLQYHLVAGERADVGDAVAHRARAESRQRMRVVEPGRANAQIVILSDAFSQLFQNPPQLFCCIVANPVCARLFDQPMYGCDRQLSTGHL